MPTLQLKISPPQPTERVAGIARRLTQLSTGILGKRTEVTVVTIDELWPGRWFVGGSTPGRPTAMLEIRVTQGTNTEGEKEEFIAAAYEELERQLGALEEASYVVVQEMPAGNWGYGGRTQAERRKEVAVL